MVWLKAPTAGTVTTLSWHPQGHLLAGASPGSPGFFVWDVATGTATPISAGPEPACLLRWSPCGSYLLAAQPGGSFRIWETQTWWSQSWAAAEGGASPSSGGRLVEAAWGPDCRSLLLAYEGSPQLVSLHFTGEPPSLQAQLLPLPLAELNAGGAAKGSTAGLVQAVAWDARAQRLAIALGGSHPAAGCAALYDTRCDPILSARFIGFLRLGPLGGSGSGGAAGGSRAAAAVEPDWEEIRPEEVAEAAGAAGSSAAAQRPAGGGSGTGAAATVGASEALQALAFLPGFGQGAVLAARCGDQRVAAVPLYFAA
ncbi:aladin isoform X1 [Chlorella sorokiniana]|uniref:Aladin isoform X1 n=1 Tax=Chlorella sorokiniana TaxID=3076 RepID=A0A2P6TW63_CHLSO|nr:aladin isoform X1 [Chlorella sorokiniana]|eukprot:PRW58299.1 aladin isoform X1 [Chlorella sorokiniana]